VDLSLYTNKEGQDYPESVRGKKEEKEKKEVNFYIKFFFRFYDPPPILSCQHQNLTDPTGSAHISPVSPVSSLSTVPLKFQASTSKRKRTLQILPNEPLMEIIHQ
jgi:hypothetical protein